MTSDLLDDLRSTTRQALAAGGGDVVDEVGLAGLLVDPRQGGLGLGDREAVLVSEELGRALSASAFLPTAVLAVTLLQYSETPAAVDLLADIAQDAAACAVAVADPTGRWAIDRCGVTAIPADTGEWLLNGTAWGLWTPASRPPRNVLVTGRAAEGTELFAVDAEVVAISPADQLDPDQGLGEFTLTDAPARLLAPPANAASAVSAAYRRGLLTVAAEQLGVARASLQSAVDYAKTRTQFGAPIGSFQAVKHRCAEMLLEAELADAVLADAVRRGSSVDAELAFIVATRAALTAAESCIHVHGGIGFTWEHPAHRYLRRARVNAHLLGPTTAHREAIARSAGLTAAERGR
jgi:alkylation response protein AidB-like acyl-CoA dehydrogenase